jgi:hypothetical protein
MASVQFFSTNYLGMKGEQVHQEIEFVKRVTQFLTRAKGALSIDPRFNEFICDRRDSATVNLSLFATELLSNTGLFISLWKILKIRNK